MINIEPWTPYFARTSLSSAGRIALTAAFADVINVRCEFAAYELPEIFAAPEDDGENDACRDLVQLNAEHTAAQFLCGRVSTFARPLEGGEIIPLDPSKWEIDDPIRRFATGAFNLDRWADPNAVLTHRLFVDSETFDQWLVLQRTPGPIFAHDIEPILDPRVRAKRTLTAKNREFNSDHLGFEVRSDSIPATYFSEIAFDTIDLTEVLRRTSLSRSTIYSYVTQGKFPEKFPLTDNRVGWSSTEVNEWIAERASRRSR